MYSSKRIKAFLHSDKYIQERKNLFLRISAASLLLIWCLGIISPAIPEVIQSNILISKIIAYNYSLVCHQVTEKIFHLNETNFLVCARCTGIYFGALLAALLMIFSLLKYFRNLLPFTLASVFLITEVIFSSIGIYYYNKLLALITGITFGAIIYIYILEVLELYIFSLRKKQSDD